MADRSPKVQPQHPEQQPKTYAAYGRTTSHKLTADDRRLEQAILQLLQERGRDKTICPSEAARLVASEGEPAGREQWEPLMQPARAAARRLVAAGVIDITQHGHPVDASTAKGPIRLRLR